MIYLLSMATLIVAAAVSFRSTQSRERILMLSTTISRPASVVFSLIGAAERAPVWRRGPTWLPSPLRITRLVPWGESAAGRKRYPGIRLTGPEEILVRHLKDREFGYRSVRRHDFSFESTFRLAPEEGKCLLTWEIRYRAYRLPDVLGTLAIEAGAKKSMQNSLALIQRLSLGLPATASARDSIYEACRDQVSAA